MKRATRSERLGYVLVFLGLAGYSLALLVPELIKQVERMTA